MKGLIQRFPAGLLPLLTIKASETPQALDESVGAGLELAPFYLAERLEVVTQTQAGISTVTFSYVTVPANEYWWLYTVSAAATNITVGSSVELTVGIGDQAGVNSYLNSMNAPRVTTTAAESVVVTGAPSQPLLLKPGMRIFGGTLFAPTSIDLVIRALISRLSVS